MLDLSSQVFCFVLLVGFGFCLFGWLVGFLFSVFLFLFLVLVFFGVCKGSDIIPPNRNYKKN